MRKIFLTIAVLASLPLAVWAGDPRSAWNVSLDDRIQARVDPALRAARIRQRPAPSSASAAGPKIVDVISGDENPELIMPTEIFERLLRVVYVAPPAVAEVYRASYDTRRADLRLPVDFWDRLHPIAMAWVRAHDDVRRSPRAAVRDAAIRSCKELAIALAMAKSEFGAEPFQRFLYEVVAPEMTLAITELETPEALRKQEEGCE